MKITERNNTAKLRFSDVKSGEVFLYAEAYYLRVQLRGEHNAVDLGGAPVPVHFDDETYITKIITDAELLV